MSHPLPKAAPHPPHPPSFRESRSALPQSEVGPFWALGDDKVWYWFNGNQGGHATSSKYECFGAGGPFDTREAAAAASIEKAVEACQEDRLEDVYAFPGTGRQQFLCGSADTIDYEAGHFGDCFIKVRFLTREKYMDRAEKGK